MTGYGAQSLQYLTIMVAILFVTMATVGPSEKSSIHFLFTMTYPF